MSLQALQNAFERERTRFIVVGGLAVVAHGYLRATRDADIVVEMLPENVERAFRALASIGYEPIIPISSADFADPEQRARWAREKNMTVLQFWSEQHRDTPVDIFLEAPFDFETEWERAYQQVLDTGETALRFASIESLIEMKEKVGRPQDLIDIQHLRWIQQELDKRKDG